MCLSGSKLRVANETLQGCMGQACEALLGSVLCNLALVLEEACKSDKPSRPSCSCTKSQSHGRSSCEGVAIASEGPAVLGCVERIWLCRAHGGGCAQQHTCDGVGVRVG